MSDEEVTPRDAALEAIESKLRDIRAGAEHPSGGVMPADLVQLRKIPGTWSTPIVERWLHAAYTIGLVRARTLVSEALPSGFVPNDSRPLCREPMRSARAWRLAAKDACAPFRPELAIHADDTGPEGDE